ncbi:peptide chain release factor N(5)-glutamine methyltransferase [Aquibaculum arenosum]|uniref:Release factor glutamine methyltransferase n=1 Tax=Aquibaculum arenosum TaxID=3032591 RepID=A0ABT5YRC8_9PROT|nr:peptide chain release factor N(5)-glutamine methyltransferase [Fodinicurvata sp. CAU 1616]MDF2097368.1 peptide chain release factor N(5)-glutamine methyltransferase [Fodinicurvata sp. CAU 1616]
MTSIGDALTTAQQELEAAGVPDARRDARLLLAALLECDISTVIAWPERGLDQASEEAFRDSIRRRAAREPVARILGVREFWSLPFQLAPETLDPRPDSELLVSALLERVRDPQAPLQALDLGSGSGCLLLALLSELPQARGLGVDCSQAAVDMATRNARNLGLAERVHFQLGDWCAGLEQRFDLLLCNPPYIPADEIDALEPEVAGWEPRGALDGGDDGLEPYRILIPQLDRLLAAWGMAIFEHGPGQAAAIAALLEQPRRWQWQVLLDLAGRERALLIRRRG